MIIKKQHAENPYIYDLGYENVLEMVEVCGRFAHMSHERMDNDWIVAKSEKFIRSLIRMGHESVLEHYQYTTYIDTDIGTAREITRHRLASFTERSTRFCRFDNEIEVIEPLFEKGSPQYHHWKTSVEAAEKEYLWLLDNGATAQEARDVLPLCTATSLACTMNIRERRHFYKLRCAKDAHPKMQHLAKMMLKYDYEEFPVFYEDIYKEVFESDKV